MKNLRLIVNFVFIFLGILALFSPSPFLSLFGLAFLPLLFTLFWKTDRPAIFFWAFLHQWLQINIGLVWADVAGIELPEMFRFAKLSEDAYLLAMCCLIALVLGVYLVDRRMPRVNYTPWLERLDPRRCFQAYLLFAAGYSIMPYLRLPGTGQLMVGLGFLKWGLFYLVFSSVMTNRRYRGWLMLLIGGEFFYSLFSIFASFKAILIYPIIFFFASYRKQITRRQVAGAFVFAVLVINLGIIWTAVKMDYRLFLAQGAKGQVIRTSRLPAMEELFSLSAKALNLDTYSKASRDMVDRLFYLEFLSATMDNIPKRMAHEDGAVTLEAIKHVLMPRIFFPNKPALHDTLHTNKYTGQYVADYKTTSMSIGYVGDFYIDFGWFAPLAVFGLGLLLGFCYRWLYLMDPNPVFGQVLVVPLFLLIYLFEISLVKLVGMLITYLLVMLVVRKFAFPRLKRMVLRRNMPPQDVGAVLPVPSGCRD